MNTQAQSRGKPQEQTKPANLASKAQKQVKEKPQTKSASKPKSEEQKVVLFWL
jgi:hypothetical protein